ncbi:MAG: hypothetical protein PWP07_1775 [Epulopiscium sp.]|jgi:hypothetical protein|uniref:Uncharacterized protein n=1 Tax=Defluviitalea raffinosedens TaxID=1450156 RepID=A0A7C8LJ72_9FIRM|nr:hypothetical protein [Defluviitalea raffinosedens]MBZ4668632.1 hypothetical protein [Defluviitaleaceae bacterium]MDK2788530.1 hypothetical protein [Candidatus Epulonipiscium sp.]KAE9637300.1 hypothetical protein GND95_02390 [Defluviitalea raffinosedens]MBM7685605.1 hypothetical protein [Defluviitalea raffinosedens]HHW66666.1 hypothetical protein [Candidatus Epulonipiscium sp.]
MEKRKRSSRSSIRRRYRNQKNNAKELVITLLLKQSGVSIALFLLIIILQFIPFKSSKMLVQNIKLMISYTMSWNEAVETVKNTAIQIPGIKNWVKKDESSDHEEKDFSNSIGEDEEIPMKQLENSYQDNDITDQDNNIDKIDQEHEIDSDEIFILEPNLGELEEKTTP